STHDFAALGIVGLKSHHSVEKYHDAWRVAIERHGASEVEPGQSIKLPAAVWPPEHEYLNKAEPGLRERMTAAAEQRNISPNMVAYVRENPNAIAAALGAEPQLLAVAVDARVRAARNEHEQRVRSGSSPRQAARATSAHDWAAELESACLRLDEATALCGTA